VRGRISRRDREKRLVLTDRFGVSFPCAEEFREPAPRIDVPRLHHQHLSIRRFRAVVIAGLFKRPPQHEVRAYGVRVVGAQADVLAVVTNRLVVPAVGFALESQRVMRVRRVGQRLLVRADRIVAPPQAFQDDAGLVMRAPLRPPIDDALPDAKGVVIFGVPCIGPGCQPEEHGHQRRGRDSASDTGIEFSAGSLDGPGGREHAEHDDRRERQIHPPFGADLRVDRDHTRCRRERDEEPGAEERNPRPPSPGDDGRHNERHDEQRLGQHIGEGQLARHAVVDHEIAGPHRQSQVHGDHLCLVEQVRPRRHRRQRPCS
jgi:hypothetical protein